MEVAINSSIYRQAQTRAKEQGLNLSTIIENFLVRFVTKGTAQQEAVPDVVLSLLGAGSAPDGSKSEQEAYYQYLEEKYK